MEGRQWKEDGGERLREKESGDYKILWREERNG
jgi:hypothetical protein